jgi:transposase
MRSGITISVSAADRRRLEAIVADRNTSQKHAWRARIILLTSDGVGTTGVMTLTGKSKTTVWRWQERFAEAGVDGLLADRTRPPGKAPVADERVAELVRLTHEPPPHEATHWTARAMAKAVGLGVATVQKIWKAHGLAPHRWRAFKLSRDPAFAEKLHDIVGLYVSPPAHAVVLSVDEKSQIQALDRTQPGLPMKKGRGATMTHDYKRHGTTTLFAALDVLDGTVFGRNMQRHRHQEFIRFLNALEREIPAGKVVHAILDNYAAHKTPEVRRWLARHPRWTFHFTPTSSSWLNAVEGFFAKLSRRRLKRGVFCSVMELQAAISKSTTTVRSPSYGGPIPTRSSPRVPEGSKHWSHSTSPCHISERPTAAGDGGTGRDRQRAGSVQGQLPSGRRRGRRCGRRRRGESAANHPGATGRIARLHQACAGSGTARQGVPVRTARAPGPRRAAKAGLSAKRPPV